MRDFVHLHVHTEYSLLDGLTKIKPLVTRTKELGMKAVAITDHGAMYGVINFYTFAREQGVKPIIGCELYMSKHARTDKRGSIDKDPFHILLLCKNYEGYQNLVKLVSAAHLEGFYYRPRIDMEILRQHAKGLIGTSACLAGEIPQLLMSGEDEKAKKKAQEFAEIFGQEHFYLELQRHPKIKEQDEVNLKVVALAKELSLPIVATNDAHYLNKDDAEAQEVLLCVQTQRKLDDKIKPLSMISSPDFYLRSPDEMNDLFEEYPEALENTTRIADMVDIEIPMGVWQFPIYTIPEETTHDQYLRKLVEERILTRYEKATPEITKRIDDELKVIEKKGYAPYVLFTWDYVQWAKDHGIAVGPGRGSGAGCIVSYILGITGIDPLFFELPYERFLNEFRPSPPDFDIDFQDDRRAEIVDYVTQKYGEDHVAQIITFGKMEARAAVRDVARALGVAYSKADKLAKLVPFGSQAEKITLDKALEIVPELSELYRKDPLETKRVIDFAKELEGVARHASTHAAGVVVTPKPLVSYAPLQNVSRGEGKMVQYDMRNVEDLGLLKSDFLGLRNLTIIARAIEIIEKERKEKIDIEKIPLTDKKTYELLSKGDTMAVFQLESSGMQRYIKELRPTSIFDLMAMVALYRPGPMQVIPEFIKRKNNPELITSFDPRMEHILSKSYGMITYQDDVLLIAIELAGYTWETVDKLRKAMGKKIPELMKQQKEKFLKGAVEQGMSTEKAQELFKLIEPFAGYGFNKAHAAAYAVIAYQTAYLKAHYPVEYMTAVLTAEENNKEKLAEMVSECRRMGIRVLPPRVNTSQRNFSMAIEGGKKAILFGLSAIKNVGEGAVAAIIEARNIGGVFSSFDDFVRRIDLKQVNKKVFESLMKCGALDEFGNRASLLSGLSLIIEKVQQEKKDSSDGQTSIFDLEDDLGVTKRTALPLPETEEFPKQQLLAFEKELLGFYLTEHPLSNVLSLLSSQSTHKIGWLQEENIVGKRVTIGGIISTLRKTFTKNGNNEMAFCAIEDETGAIEAVVFPKVFAKTKEVWVVDQIVLLTGRVEYKDETLSFLVESAKTFSEEDAKETKRRVEIKVPKGTPVELLKEVNTVFRENPGKDTIVIVVENGGGVVKRLVLPYTVNYTVNLARQVASLLKQH